MNYEDFKRALDKMYEDNKLIFYKKKEGIPMEYKQLIIARKDLNMSHGKLAAQVAHASMALLTAAIRKNSRKAQYGKQDWWGGQNPYCYETNLRFSRNLFENWIEGSFTKVVCRAKNKNDLEKAIKIANDLGLQEGVDYFLIKDNCLTELKPEEDGRTLTCIGFKPMPKEDAEKISKHFQLYR